MNDSLYDDVVLENPECPMCRGLGIPLGILGKLEWFRCESCGINFNQGVGE